MKHQLTVLSFGAGQDSSYILYMIIGNPLFRERFVKGKLIVIFSDTGNEHPHTYEHLKYITKLCHENDIDFANLKESQYHPNTWKTLDHQYKRNKSIMCMMFPRSCTDNLKIKPIYNFLDHYIGSMYYAYRSGVGPKGKKFIKQFAQDHGKIDVIIGIAADETKRVAKPSNNGPVWFRNSINRVYPLIELGIGRKEIHKQLKGAEYPLPFPSNCLKCPFISKIELVWLYRFYPEVYSDWVEDEKAKVKKYEGRGKNLGVKGEKMLPEVLKEALDEYGDMTNKELTEYKMSHGHCVASSY